MTFLYTDTDSFHIHAKCAKLLEEMGWVRNELGYLDDELSGGLVIASSFLAPKTYNYEYVTPDGKVLCCTKCKGIPHTSSSYEYNVYNHVDEEGRKLVRDYFDKSVSLMNEFVVFNKPCYVYTPGFKEDGTENLEGEEKIFLSRIHPECFKDVLLNSHASLFVLYGGMKRYFDPYAPFGDNFMSITSQYSTRSLYATRWWEQNNRILFTTNESNWLDQMIQISYPQGFRFNLQ